MNGAEVVELICWDFGNTLVHERWLRQAPDSVPEWPYIYESEVMRAAGLWSAWCLGDATTDDIAEYLAPRVDGMDAAAIKVHLAEASRRIDFFPAAWQAVTLAAAAGDVRQACATVNPDLFSDVVVPTYQLDEVFDVIVTSWEMKSKSKVRLGEEARRQLGLDPGDLSRTLLIDNKESNIDEFAAAGGQVYLFTSDAAFSRDVLAGHLPAVLGE